MKQVDESFDGREIELASGDELEIRLAENRTTGFKWDVAGGGEGACELVKDSDEAAKGVGQTGSHLWQFRATRIGACKIELAYRRSWETDTQPARTFTLKVRVTK